MQSEKYDQQKLNNKLKNLQDQLPEFTRDFFRGISDLTQIKTRIAYAFDLRTFFYYLNKNHALFEERSGIKDFVVEDMDQIRAVDIEKFSEYLNDYELPHYTDEQTMIHYSNSAQGKMRKLSALRSFYKYYYKKEMISTNPAVLVDLPKLHEKPIVRLEPNEIVDLLNSIENGEQLTSGQKRYYDKNHRRDLSMIALLLGTGIRISECVGLNISDFDMQNNSFRVIRKGGTQTILFLPEEVKNLLIDYLQTDRYALIPIDEYSQDATFLSLQKRRMTVSAVEKMLKKYTKYVVPLKNISPHKLRSTFGTNLYRETGDIYLVADVLGHKDVNTTKKHYAAIDEDRRKIAAKVTKLRKE
ncbi:MAG: tyrosine-type recombinase/integrase [Anaerofustis sp.]